MNVPLALCNLRHDRMRTLVALAGVAFAVVLVLLQIGFFMSVWRTATRIYDRLEFDLLLSSQRYLHLSKAGNFPRVRLNVVASDPSVKSVVPMYLGFNLWRNPQTARRRGILIMAFNPRDKVLDLPEVQAQQALLQEPDTILVDERSRPEFGPRERGLVTEVGRRRVRVVGTFPLGTGFGADGALLTSDETYLRLAAGANSENVSLGLVTLQDPTQADAVAAALRAALPPDVHVFTRAEIEIHERMHWVIRTSVGFIFGLGAIVALIVGVAIVYQVLASDISNHIKEYATLLALGYDQYFLGKTVLTQGCYLAVGGFVPGFVVAWMIYAVTRHFANVPMEMTWQLASVVFLLTLGMCTFSGLLALRKTRSAAPADLF